MNWFDKWLARKVQKAWEDARNPSFHISKGEAIQLNSISIGAKTADLVSRDRMDSNPDLTFKMYRAENGYIMEVRQYDKRSDRHSTNLHLIPDDADLGSSIAQIITVESLKVQ
jgi:hypothetical protein